MRSTKGYTRSEDFKRGKKKSQVRRRRASCVVGRTLQAGWGSKWWTGLPTGSQMG